VNHGKHIRDRIIALLAADAAASAMLKTANRSQADDPRRYPVPRGKPTVGASTDFPELDWTVGAVDEPSYVPGDDWTIDMEPPETVQISQTIDGRLIHEAMNDDDNEGEAATVRRAIRNGGRQLALPGQPDTALPYVLGWGITHRRQAEWVKEGARHVTRISVNVIVLAYRDELETDE
jgi:hypothetical protein